MNKNETCPNRELVSALVDGELTTEEFASAVDSATGTREGLASWQAYHLVGDALRGCASPAALDGSGFVARLRARMDEQEVRLPLPQRVAPQAPAPVADAARAGANDPVMRWKMLAGFATLAAVATAGWHVASLDARQGAMAQVPTRPQTLVAARPAAEPQAAAHVTAAAPVMLRDARLDELLAAHKQFGGTSALQMPAGFLRNATFDGVDR